MSKNVKTKKPPYLLLKTINKMIFRYDSPVMYKLSDEDI